MRALSSGALAASLLLASGCARLPIQTDTHEVAPASGHGAVVEIRRIEGKYPEVTSVGLHFYLGPFTVPMHPVGNETWRAELTPEQVKSLPVERQGFRVYWCKLEIASKSPAGETDVTTRSMNVTLPPN